MGPTQAQTMAKRHHLAGHFMKMKGDMMTSTIEARMKASIKGGTGFAPTAQELTTKFPAQHRQHNINIAKSKARMEWA